MKAILEFDIDNPEDQMKHQRCLKSLDMALMLFEIQFNLRKTCDRIAECQEADSDIADGVYIVFEQLNKLFEENKIDIEELIN